MRRFKTAAVTLGVVAFMCAVPHVARAQGTRADSNVPIHATVVSVNRKNGTVVLRYARPGSQPQTKHAFTLLNRNDVLRLHPRAVIDGTADMSGKAWTLANVNVESERPLGGEISP